MGNYASAQLIGCYRQGYFSLPSPKPLDKCTNPYNKQKWGFLCSAPFKVSNACCTWLKKKPAYDYYKKNGITFLTGQMASESKQRAAIWLRYGCNMYDAKIPKSNPLSFWTEADILEYAYMHDISLAPPYGKIVKEGGCEANGLLGLFDLDRPILSLSGLHRTGCYACGFGIHLDKDCRLEALKEYGGDALLDWTLRGGGFSKDGLWEPKGGLGLAFVYEWLNRHGQNINIFIPNKEKYLEALPNEAKIRLG